jgi:hypothetical protein
MKAFTLSFMLLVISSPVLAETPKWAIQAPAKVSGAILVGCHGEGPDRSTAYQSALNECRSLASDTLTHNFEVRTLSVETEKRSGYHEEVSSNYKVSGLECEVKKIQEEGQDIWLLCSFLTKNVHIMETPKISHSLDIVSSNKQVILSTFPKCESILVLGANGRKVKCGSNPMILIVKEGDQELVIRSGAYKPAHVYPEAWQNSQPLAVYLEP